MEENTDQNLSITERLRKNLENMSPEKIEQERARIAQVISENSELKADDEAIRRLHADYLNDELSTQEIIIRNNLTKSYKTVMNERNAVRKAHGLGNLRPGPKRNSKTTDTDVLLAIKNLSNKLDHIIELLEGGA